MAITTLATYKKIISVGSCLNLWLSYGRRDKLDDLFWQVQELATMLKLDLPDKANKTLGAWQAYGVLCDGILGDRMESVVTGLSNLQEFYRRNTIE